MKKVLLSILAVLMFGGSAFAGGTINIGVASEAMSMDPYVHNETATNSILSNLYDTLVMFSADYKQIPGLAVASKALDETTWEIKLREGVKFHNGNAFNADDVIFSFYRLKTWDRSGFKGKVSSILSAEKKDDYTVIFKTKGPHPLLLRKLTYMKILDKEYCETQSAEYLGNNPNGTGPYVFVKWNRGAMLELKANKEYWGGEPKIERVVFKTLTNDSTRVAAILSNEVDLINRVPVKDINRIKTSINFVMKSGLRLIYLQMDHARKNSPYVTGDINPFLDVRVRRAVYHAINEDNIIKYIMNGFAESGGQFYAKSIFGYDESIKRIAYDPAKAKQLLAEAGYPNGFEVVLDAPNNRYVNDEQIAQAIAADLAKVGVKVKVNAMPKSSFFKKVNGTDSSFNLIGWAGGDPSSFLDACVHSYDPDNGYGRYNGGRYSNSEVDRLIEESDVTIDPAKRLELVQKAQRLATVGDQSFIPLHFQVDLYAYTDKITFKPRVDSHLYVYEMSKK